MTCAEGICFEPRFKFLICRIHGSGVHPTRQAIKRHLRGDGHCCRGERLRQAVSTLTSLPLKSLQEVLNDQPPLELQPIEPPIPHLKVLKGWNCMPCEGRTLTSSLEIIQRHSALVHDRQRGDPPTWVECQLQTFFSETKDRRYFRVICLPATTELDGKHGYTLSDQRGVHACREQATQGAATAEQYAEMPLDSIANKISAEKDVSAPPDEVTLRELQHSRSQSSELSLVQSITLKHPLTHIAERYIRLPVSRLDYLLKSEAFRYAPNPVFDPSHVDSALRMGAVLPQCEDEPVFLNALVFSIIQVINRGNLMLEGLSLQGRIFQLMKVKLTSRPEAVSPGVIGAIMLLKSTAYRTRNVVAHDVHTRGLSDALKIVSRNGESLTPAALRAMFWLDLNAAVAVGSKRQMSHNDLPQKMSWQRERYSQPWHFLPAGFARCRPKLPYELLACIVDVAELQTTLLEKDLSQSPRASKFHELDAMQASIESRLEYQAQECRQHGVVAEAIRLGIFMCCYCSWTDTWNDGLVPCRLAEMLLDLLEPVTSLYPQQVSGVWLQHIDVLLWLLFVGSSVVRLDRGELYGLKSRQSYVVESVISWSDTLCNDYKVNLKEKLLDSLTDFIYKDEWLQQRWCMKEWSELEQLFSTKNISDE